MSNPAAASQSSRICSQGQGYKPTRQGKDWAIACPFHEGDDTPSLIISPKSNLFHCFGCEAAGSVIDWVMRTQGLSFRHAVEVLREDAGLVAFAARALAARVAVASGSDTRNTGCRPSAGVRKGFLPGGDCP